MFDDDEVEAPGEEFTVFMHILFYKGSYYTAECVERTKDTCYFQVDTSLVRKGIFPKGRLDMRFFKEMGIELIPVHNPPMLEQ